MKLSKHPVGTFIHLEGEGHFEKVDKGLWRRADETANFLTKKYLRKIEKNEPFRITVIAAPWRVVTELLVMLQEEYGYTDAEGEPITLNGIYKDAVAREEEDRRIQEEQHRAYVNYCERDVEATENLVRRAIKPSVIYKTQKL